MAFTAVFSQRKAASHEEGHWIPLSDLMTGLMMVFMLIAIIFMVNVESDAKVAKQNAMQAQATAKSAEQQADLVKSIAVIYDQMRLKLYNDLYREFEKDLPGWGAVLFRDLTIRFKEPEVLFDTGKDVLKPRFIDILADFFPRYVRILSSPPYRNAIEEVRIEGHTSSMWENAPPERAYYKNMQLSQSRTRTVLEHVLELPSVSAQQSWLKSHLTANGLSSSKIIRLTDGREDARASQRVEFRVKTNADDKIAEILKQANLQ
jgi:outer membrane protein OmpA-like peptidoglycan-associated protein